MTTKKQTHGGAGRSQGRKPLQEGAPTVAVSLKMTEPQRDKLGRLGGPKWVRARIDKAREPAAETAQADEARLRELHERTDNASRQAGDAMDRFARGEITRAQLKASTAQLGAVTKEWRDALKALKAGKTDAAR